MSRVRGRWRRRADRVEEAGDGAAASTAAGAASSAGTPPAAPSVGIPPAAPSVGTSPVVPSVGVPPAAPSVGIPPAAPTEPAEAKDRPERRDHAEERTRTASVARYQAGWHRALRFVAQRFVLRGLVKSITSVHVEGVRNLDGLTEPFVVVANHSSHLDATVIVTHLPRRVTRHLAVAAAADYFYDSWYRKAATSLFFNSYPVYRGKGTGKGRGMSVRLLAAGVPVLIFPEGTRSRDGVMRRFKPGAAALCVAQDAPVVPIALIGAREAMPVGQAWPSPGRPPIRMLVGRPMHPRPSERVRDFNARVEARVSAMLTMRTPYVLGDAPRDHRPPAAKSGDETQEEAS